MELARHPERDEEMITVIQYLQDFGPGPHDEKDQARCPFCKRRLLAKGFSTTETVEYFAHGPNSGFCPSKTNGVVSYGKDPPKNPDFGAAKELRRKFRTNWRKHCCKLQEIIVGLDWKEFTNAIALSNDRRIWEYAKLQEWQLPYIFATLTEFPPGNSYKRNGVPVRKYWFRCWFDAFVQSYEDMCSYQSDLQFWRASYNSKGKAKPKREQICKIRPLDFDDAFLKVELKENQPLEFVQNEVESWLNQHFSVD